ncbi:MAG: hypothetical protein ABIZ34_05095 [Candidatus Limnocylindrales bacterium]
MPSIGRSRGSGGAISALILGGVFIAIGLWFHYQPFAGPDGTVFLALGGVLVLIGVVWSVVKLLRRGRDVPSNVQWMQPDHPMPNTLSQTTPMAPMTSTQMIDPATGQPMPGAQVFTSVSGAGSIDPALLQQLAQVGMAIADQFEPGVGFSQGSVTVMPPTVIDLRGALGQQNAGVGTPMGLMAGVGAMQNDLPINGHATIDAVRSLGVVVEGQPVVEFDLTVQPDGAASYPLTQRAMVPANQTERAVAGASVPVRIVSSDPPIVMVAWDASAQT